MSAAIALNLPVAGRPLSASIGATRAAVQEALDLTDPSLGYRMIARLSGHLAAMRRTVFRSAEGRPGVDPGLQAACLSGARAVERALRLLEQRLSGDAFAAGLPVPAAVAALARRLESYWPAERELVGWLEGQLTADGCGQLARAYVRALTCAPTRPHPRCPRSRLLHAAAFWLYGRWDRLLDTVDSRSGVGQGFPAAHSGGWPA